MNLTRNLSVFPITFVEKAYYLRWYRQFKWFQVYWDGCPKSFILAENTVFLFNGTYHIFYKAIIQTGVRGSDSRYIIKSHKSYLTFCLQVCLFLPKTNNRWMGIRRYVKYIYCNSSTQMDIFIIDYTVLDNIQLMYWVWYWILLIFTQSHET